jgi:hypothetical protein
MTTDENLPIHEMTIDEMREILGELGENLPPEQLMIMAQFVAQAGGLENAQSAIEAIATLRDAA